MEPKKYGFGIGIAAMSACALLLVGSPGAQTMPNLTVSLNSRHYTHVFVLFVRNDGCERAV
jgi:hypothetical protein